TLFRSVINATRFGIPQVRERVVMIGSLNSEMDLEADIEHIRKMILSEDKHFFSSYTVWDAISNLSEAHSENGVVHVKPTNRYQKSLSTIDYVCFNHTLPSHAKKTIQRMNKLKQGENFQQLDEIIKSVHSGSYGRLKNG
ncbi:MAG: DNA cytosine methyltransferase, partial [Candidatus Cloacimonas sp.]|nr:DNA cytosine methyltransferase [Candidatus Cloacimonas sp.]